MTSNTLPRPVNLIARLGAVVLVVLALGVVGCSEDDPTAPGVPETFDHSSSNTAGGLRLTVSTRKATVDFGDDVEARVTLTNVSDQEQVLDFSRGRPARFPNLGLNFKSSDDVTHHADGDGERDDFPLAAGASISATFTWDQTTRFGGAPVDRGTFNVVAFVGFDDRETLRVGDLFILLD